MLKKYFYITLVLFLFSFILVIESRKQCFERKGKNTIYCVCNSTHCDELDGLTKQVKGSLLMYQTSQSGDRFKESKLKFSKSVSPLGTPIVLTIDRTKRYQKIIGMGAAFTDSALINIDSLPEELSHHVIRDYFSPKGIEYSVARIPIGGTDYSVRWYTYDDGKAEDFELKNWKLQEEDIKHKIPNIKLALNVSSHGIRLFGSPWQTPHWLNNKTALKNQGDKHYHTWANYMVKFLDAYKSNDIHIWGMTMQNEPKSFDSMNFVNPEVERDFVTKHLGPALVRAGYTKDKFNLMVYDDGSAQNPIIPYVQTILNETEAHKYVTGIAYHCYLPKNISGWVKEFKHDYPDQFIISTECTQNSRHNTDPLTPSTLGDWRQAEDYTHLLMNVYANNISGWVEWNLALDTYGHPKIEPKAGDSPVLIDAKKKEYYKNPNFYALGHFSKFIAPDSVRVDVSASKVENKFEFIAFERPDNSTTIIVSNLSEKPIDFVIKVSDEGEVVSKIGEHCIQSYIYWN